MNNPKPQKLDTYSSIPFLGTDKFKPRNAYEEISGKTLTSEQIAEMKFNLVNFVETLITLDQQQQCAGKRAGISNFKGDILAKNGETIRGIK